MPEKANWLSPAVAHYFEGSTEAAIGYVAVQRLQTA